MNAGERRYTAGRHTVRSAASTAGNPDTAEPQPNRVCSRMTNDHAPMTNKFPMSKAQCSQRAAVLGHCGLVPPQADWALVTGHWSF